MLGIDISYRVERAVIDKDAHWDQNVALGPDVRVGFTCPPAMSEPADVEAPTTNDRRPTILLTRLDSTQPANIPSLQRSSASSSALMPRAFASSRACQPLVRLREVAWCSLLRCRSVTNNQSQETASPQPPLFDQAPLQRDDTTPMIVIILILDRSSVGRAKPHAHCYFIPSPSQTWLCPHLHVS